jgi:ATP-binding cassette, subfamily C, bacterial CydC
VSQGRTAGAAGRRPLLRLLWLARPMRGRLLLAVVAGAAATGCGVALLAVSGFMLARASEHPSIEAISVAVVAVRGLSVGRAVSRYVERLASHDVAFRILAGIRVTIYRHLERLAPAGLAAFRSGDLLARLISDVDATQDLFIRGVGPPFAAALVGAGAVTACLAILAPAAGLLALGLLAAGLAVPALAVAASRRAARLTAPARGALGATLADLLAGAAELHAFGAQDAALADVGAADAALAALERRSATASGIGGGLMTAASGLTLWGVLLLGVHAVAGGALTRVPLAVLALTALAAFEAVTALPAAALQLGASRVSAARIGAVLDAAGPVTEPARPRPLPAGPVRVRMAGVQARYEPGGPLALDGLDLDLRPGRRVAIVGRSGAGKSTVAAVLLRFLDPAGGTVTIAGPGGPETDLAACAADDVRTVIGGCPQDSHIFHATVRDNLALARPGAGDDELAAAAARARLLPWIRSLPQGLDTRVGAGGTAMSGGERQRLALARALLADPGLLILDEPTAHLDPEAAAALTADLLAATAGRSTLLITHDTRGLDQVDEIVVLDRGRAVQRGTHRELISADGPYRRLQAARQEPPLPAAAPEVRCGAAGPAQLPALPPHRPRTQPRRSPARDEDTASPPQQTAAMEP